MPKVPARNNDRYKIAGGQLNEFETVQNRGALAEHQRHQEQPHGQSDDSSLPPDIAKAERTKELLAAHGLSSSHADKSADTDGGPPRTSAEQHPNQESVTPQGAEADNQTGVRVKGKAANKTATRSASRLIAQAALKNIDGPGPATVGRSERRSTAGTSSGARNATARSDEKAMAPSKASFAARSGKNTTTHAAEKRAAPAAAARAAGRTEAQARADRPAGTVKRATDATAKRGDDAVPKRTTAASAKRAAGATTTSASDRKAAAQKPSAGSSARTRQTTGPASGEGKTAAARSSRSTSSKR